MRHFHAQFQPHQPAALQGGLHHFGWRAGAWSLAGVYSGLGHNNNGWCGEGEIKFYIDGDKEWLTICGTGTLTDYFWFVQP
ncbi:MAG: DUF2961 domain-containing protein [Caldilineaceae bacterium]